MLFLYITTPYETESFPFTIDGFKQASKLYTKYADQIHSDDDQYTLQIFSDDGLSDIEFVSPQQLTKSQLLMYRLFKQGVRFWDC